MDIIAQQKVNQALFDRQVGTQETNGEVAHLVKVANSMTRKLSLLLMQGFKSWNISGYGLLQAVLLYMQIAPPQVQQQIMQFLGMEQLEHQQVLNMKVSHPWQTFTLVLVNREVPESSTPQGVIASYHFMPCSTCHKGRSRCSACQASKSDIARINAMFTQHTKGKVNKVLVTGRVEPHIFQLVTFDSVWKVAFMEPVQQLFFALIDDQIVESRVHMMEQQYGQFQYVEGEQFQLLELEYKDSDWVMGLWLPSTVTFFYPQLDQLQLAMNRLRPTVLKKVQVPVFQHNFRLGKIKPLLETIGVGILSEFSYVSQVVQFGVSHFGEAEGRGRVDPGVEKEFVANHPFWYYLRYKPTNALVLSGSFYGN